MPGRESYPTKLSTGDAGSETEGERGEVKIKRETAKRPRERTKRTNSHFLQKGGRSYKNCSAEGGASGTKGKGTQKQAEGLIPKDSDENLGGQKTESSVKGKRGLKKGTDFFRRR